jgi:MFS family permease
LLAALDEASLSRFHLRAVLVSGMRFFTDAYDLFVIEIASTLITKDWNLSSGRLALLNSTMLFAAFLGAFVFGHILGQCQMMASPSPTAWPLPRRRRSRPGPPGCSPPGRGLTGA